jgi:hypothetical protein
MIWGVSRSKARRALSNSATWKSLIVFACSFGSRLSGLRFASLNASGKITLSSAMVEILHESPQRDLISVRILDSREK